MTHTIHPVLQSYRNALAVHVMWFKDKKNGGITEGCFPEILKVINIFQRDFDAIDF